MTSLRLRKSSVMELTFQIRETGSSCRLPSKDFIIKLSMYSITRKRRQIATLFGTQLLQSVRLRFLDEVDKRDGLEIVIVRPKCRRPTNN